MSCHKKYLEEFLNHPNNIEEYKVNFLKKYYLSIVNCYFNIELKEFKIGATKDKNKIHFASNIDDKKLIYNIKEKKYYENTNNDLFEIDLNDYKIELFREDKKVHCLNYSKCIIL